MTENYDVAIIGGGPAGSTAATLLARAGRRVIVLEREKFPRFHIGESLLPYSMPVFDRLGVRAHFDDTFLHKHGAELLTSCGSRVVRFLFRNGFRIDHHRAYQVERSVFDEKLLDHAAANGAEVRQQTRVEKVEFTPDGAQLEIAGRDGTMEPIRASYVIDASGRHSVLGTQLGSKQRYPTLNKFSVFAHFDGVTREAGEAGTLTRMLRARDRWFWIIPITETRTSIGVVLDAAKFQAAKQSAEEFLEEAIAAQPVLMDRMAGAQRATPVYATGDYSYRNTRFTGERWIMAGDSAGFIDPVFSTGVYLAMASGESAADAVDTALRAPGKRAGLFHRYEKRIGRVMDLYLRFVKAWYSDEFIEVVCQPTARFQLAAAVNSVLAGNITGGWALRWRMELFYLVVRLQRSFTLCPRLDLRPAPPVRTEVHA